MLYGSGWFVINISKQKERTSVCNNCHVIVLYAVPALWNSYQCCDNNFNAVMPKPGKTRHTIL